MPKKFATENTKAATARARKAAAKEVEESRRKQAVEDALWAEDDKHILKKQQRKEENLKKKEEQQRKKAETKALLETEMASDKYKASAAMKVTRAQIQVDIEKRNIQSSSSTPKIETHLTKPLEENINRVEVEGDEARSVTEAISILSVNSPQEDRHPERRLKAAYTAFEETNMPRIKQENPTLRLSQLKQILRKEWMKSPENPINQHIS